MPLLDRLNALADADLARDLLRCCGSQAWVARMLAARPFESLPDLLRKADAAWAALTREDRLDAFRAHPRIGERAADGWSAQEQARVADADRDVRTALAEANRAYERRFGHIFIVCASGKSAGEMLALLNARLANDPARELDIAAEEQRKIARLRLEKLVGHAV